MPVRMPPCAVHDSRAPCRRGGGDSSLKLEADRVKCIHCKLCNKSCPMSIDVHSLVTGSDMYSPECISCAACADVCPRGVLSFRWTAPEKRRAKT